MNKNSAECYVAPALCLHVKELNESISMTHMLAKSTELFMKYCLFHIFANLVTAVAAILKVNLWKKCNSFM